MYNGKEVMFDLPIRILQSPLGPPKGMDRNDGSTAWQRHHLRVWPHRWVVVGPENINEADNTCGTGGTSQD